MKELAVPMANELTLADWLQEAHQPNQATQPTKRPLWRLKPSAPVSQNQFAPSGATLNEVAALADALATALRRLHQDGQTLAAATKLAHIAILESGPNWRLALPPSADPTSSRAEQTTLAAIFYHLLSGESLPLDQPHLALRRLAESYPETATVLQQVWGGGYASATELAGAFGWSLYRHEQVRVAGQTTPKASKRVATLAQPADMSEADSTKAAASGLSTVMAFSSLALALLMLVGFIVYSTISNSTPSESSVPKSSSPGLSVSPRATMLARFTVAPVLQTTRASDGAAIMRFNGVNLAATTSFDYAALRNASPGSVSVLSGGRGVQVATVHRSAGQNIYLGLQDGGWEAWDTMSKTRISRRELPNAEQYLKVSWSPDGENFAAIGLDGQLRLGSEGRILKTVPYATDSSSTSGYAWHQMSATPFNWSPNSDYLIAMPPGMNLNAPRQLWSFRGDGVQPIQPGDETRFGGWRNEGGQPGAVAWSGDSSSFAFLNVLANRVVVYEAKSLSLRFTVDLLPYLKYKDSSGTSRYLDARGWPAQFSWSPDGRYMALLRWVAPGNVAYNNLESSLTILEVGGLGRTPNSAPPELPRPQVIEYGQLYGASFNSPPLLDWSADNDLLVNLRRSDEAAAANEAKPGESLALVYARENNKGEWVEQSRLLLPDRANISLVRWWNLLGQQRILVNTDDGGVAIYRVQDGLNNPALLEQKVIEAGRQSLQQLTIAPDGQRVAAYENGQTLLVRDLPTGRELARLPITLNQRGEASSFVIWSAPHWSPDGQHLAAVLGWVADKATRNYEAVLRVWKLDASKPTVVGDMLLPVASSANSFAWNIKAQKPEILFELGQNTVVGWEVGRPLPPLEEQGKLLRLFQPSNNLVAGQPLPTTPTVSPATSRAELPYRIVGRLDVNGINGLRSSPSNRGWAADWQMAATHINMGIDYAIVRLRLPSDYGKPSLEPVPLNPTLEFNNQSPGTIAFSPDNKLVAFGLNNGLVNVYDTQSGQLVQSLAAHQGMVTEIKFAPDGQRLSTVGTDRAIKVWEVASWRSSHLLRGAWQSVTDVQWQADSKSLVTNSGFGNGVSLRWRLAA